MKARPGVAVIYLRKRRQLPVMCNERRGREDDCTVYLATVLTRSRRDFDPHSRRLDLVLAFFLNASAASRLHDIEGVDSPK